MRGNNIAKVYRIRTYSNIPTRAKKRIRGADLRGLCPDPSIDDRS